MAAAAAAAALLVALQWTFFQENRPKCVVSCAECGEKPGQQ
jgi:hypothetical protein